MRRNEEQTLFHKVQTKFREFRVLVFGPIPQGQSAELDLAEKKFREFREFRGFRVMDLACSEPLKTSSMKLTLS